MTEQVPSKEQAADAHLEETAAYMMQIVTTRPHPRDYDGHIFLAANGPRWKIDNSASREQYFRDSVAYWRKQAQSAHEPSARHSEASQLADEITVADAETLLDGELMDRVCAFLRASQPPAVSQQLQPLFVSSEVERLRKALRDLKEGIEHNATDVVWYSGIQTACDRIDEILIGGQSVATEWQPIETAPKSGNFQVCLDTCPHLSWPAHADDGYIYSNAHGVLNVSDGYGRITRATHWRPAHSPPTKCEGQS